MKSLAEVLRTKEEEILRVKRELEALKIAAGLLGDDDRSSHPDHRTEHRQLLQMP